MTDQRKDLPRDPELLRRLEEEQAIEGIRRGLESMARGEGRPAEDAFEELRARFRILRAK